MKHVYVVQAVLVIAGKSSLLYRIIGANWAVYTSLCTVMTWKDALLLS